MVTIAIPDTDLVVREWLRTVTAVTTLVASGRIDMGTVADTADPSIAVTRVGGGDDASEAPVDVALIQIECWSGSSPSRTQAAAVKNAVRNALKTLRDATVGTTLLTGGAQVVSDLFVPDPANDRPRYVLTVSFNARQTS